MSDTAPPFDLPVWTVEMVAEGDRTWFPRSMASSTINGQIVVPLFTDIDLAKRFAEDSVNANGESGRVVEIPTSRDLDVLLHYAFARGIRTVGVDVPHFTRPHERGWHFDLPDLIRRCCGPF